MEICDEVKRNFSLEKDGKHDIKHTGAQMKECKEGAGMKRRE